MTKLMALMPMILGLSKDWIGDHKDLFEYSSVVTDLLRTIGFGIIQGLTGLVDILMDGIKKVYGILNFAAIAGANNENPNGIGDWIASTAEPIFVALIGVTLVIVGVLMIIGSDKVKGSKVMQNIGLSIAIVLLMPSMITVLNNTVINDYVTGMKQELAQDSNYAQLVDLGYLLGSGNDPDEMLKSGDTLPISEGASLTDKYGVNINQLIDGEKKATKDGAYTLNDNWDVFKYRISTIYTKEGSTGYIYQEVDYDGLMSTGFGSDAPYRYSFKFWQGIFSLGVVIAVCAFTIFRCVVLAYELVVKELIAYILAATDIANGEKMKFIILKILHTYLTLCYCVTAIVLFSKALSFIDLQFEEVILRLIAKVAIAIAVIDGPNIMKQIFGIDAGVKDGYNAFDRGLRMTKGAYRTGKAVGSKAIEKASKIGNNLMQGKYTADAQKAKASVASSQAEKAKGKLAAAEEALNNAKMSGDADKIAKAQDKYNSAQSAYAAAQERANDVKAKSNVARAERNLNAARSELAAAERSGNYNDIRKAEGNLEHARADLNKARGNVSASAGPQRMEGMSDIPIPRTSSSLSSPSSASASSSYSGATYDPFQVGGSSGSAPVQQTGQSDIPSSSGAGSGAGRPSTADRSMDVNGVQVTTSNTKNKQSIIDDIKNGKNDKKGGKKA